MRTAAASVRAALVALLAIPTAARAQSAPPVTPPPASARTLAASSPPAAFPVPTIDGKALSLPLGQRTLRLPMRLARAEAFYRERLQGAAGVRFAAGLDERGRTLTITSTREGDAWSKAVLRDDPTGTAVELTPVVRLSRDVIEGRAGPAVQLVLPPDRSSIREQADSIDHLRRSR